MKQVFMALLSFGESLSSIDDTPDHVKCISLNNQQCMTQLTFINLHPNEYIEGLHYSPFTVNLDRCMRGVTLLVIFNKVCIPNKLEDLNGSVFIMVIKINDSKY